MLVHVTSRFQTGSRAPMMMLMPSKSLAKAIERAETWPPEVQDALARLAEEMDEEMRAGPYLPTPEELDGIDRGLEAARAGRFATEAEIQAIFAPHHQA